MGKRRKPKYELPPQLDSERLDAVNSSVQLESSSSATKDTDVGVAGAAESPPQGKAPEKQEHEQQSAGGQQPQRMSKAQKRREKRAAEERMQAETVARAKENLVDYNVEERIALAEKLRPLSLRVQEVVADGHCMFRAACVGLEQYGDLEACGGNGEVSTMERVRAIRSAVAEHMRNHADAFAPFFDPDALAAATDTDDRPETFEQYCRTIADTSCWGGQLELRAIAEVTGRRVDVFHAHADVVAMQPSAETQKGADAEPLRFAYHRHAYKLGEHYNAVTRLQ